MNSEERTSDKAKKYFEKLKNYMSNYTDCELNYYEVYYNEENMEYLLIKTEEYKKELKKFYSNKFA